MFFEWICPPATEKRAGEKNHLTSAGGDVTIPNYELLAEDEAIVEDLNRVCLALSHLCVFFAQTVLSSRIPEEYGLILLSQLKGYPYPYFFS